MKTEILAIPEFRERVSPLLDVATRFVLLEVQSGTAGRRQSIEFTGDSDIGTMNVLIHMGVSIIICDRVSCYLSRVGSCRGLRLITSIQGPVNDVLQDYLDGKIFYCNEEAACRGRNGSGRCGGKGYGRGQHVKRRYYNEDGDNNAG